MLVLGGYIRAQATSKRQDGRCKRPVNPCDISNRSPPSFTGKVGRQSRGTGSSRWMTELALALESPDSLWDHLERGGGEGQSGQWGLRGGPAVQTCCSRGSSRALEAAARADLPSVASLSGPGPASPAPPENSRKWGGNNGRKCSGKRRPHPCQPRHLRRQGDLGQEGPLVISSLNVLLDLEVLPPPTPVTGLGTSPLEELGGLHKPPPPRRRGWRPHSRLPVPRPLAVLPYYLRSRQPQSGPTELLWEAKLRWPDSLGSLDGLRLDHRKPLRPLFTHSVTEGGGDGFIQTASGEEGPDPQGDPRHRRIKRKGPPPTGDAPRSVAVAVAPGSGRLWQTGFSRTTGGVWGSCRGCVRASSERVGRWEGNPLQPTIGKCHCSPSLPGPAIPLARVVFCSHWNMGAGEM